MLSIIIPYHNEKPKDLAPLMTSLNMQVGINFKELEIIMCSDTEKSLIDTYSFKEYSNITKCIKKIKSPTKNNPGLSRQAGLDVAIGEYVIFCDADDCLYSVGVLREILENINLSHADVYRYRFIEEIGSFDNDQLVYKIKDFNWIWVFSKIYRREFLKQHNIHFSEKLMYHEDNYFNTVLSYCDPKVVDINSTPMYLWRFNKNSITRLNNHEYTFNSVDELLEARALSYRRVIGELKKDCTRDIIIVIVREYLVLVDPKNANQKVYDRVAKRFYEFVKEFTPTLITHEYAPELTNFIYEIYRASDSNFIPRVSLKDFLLELKAKFDS